MSGCICICVVLTEREFLMFEVVLVGRFCILLGVGVAGMLSSMLQLCYVRCACVFFLANRRSGNVE